MKLFIHMNPVIHILDQSREYRRILEECLLTLGYSNVETFNDPDLMLEYRSKPDIIILDHEMGNARLSGLEFFRLYGHREFRTSKFIFLSSNLNPNIAVSAIRMGAFDYIIKSKMGLDRLINRVGKLVQAHREGYRKTLLFRVSLVSFSLLACVLALAVYFYNHSGL